MYTFFYFSMLLAVAEPKAMVILHNYPIYSAMANPATYLLS